MSGGSKSKSSNKPPKQFKGAFSALGDATEGIIGDITSTPTFVADFTNDEQRAFQRIRDLRSFDPALGQAERLFNNNPGIGALQGININAERARATRALENFAPTALRAERFNDLRNFNSNALRNTRPDDIRRFNSQNLRNFRPDDIRRFDSSNVRDFRADDLRGLDFDRLEETADGAFLDVANNPFLSQALQDAQRITTERFTRDVQPALAAQFGGGFGLTGSSSINAQRRAAEDLSRALSEQATSTFADQFNRERAFQESARSQLAGLNFNRAQALDQFDFNRRATLDSNLLARAQSLDSFDFNRAQALDANRFARAQALDNFDLSRAGQLDANALARAQSLGQLGLQRAQAIDSSRLGRAQSLGQLGLGFTNAGISRASNLGQLSNQRAAGIANIGAQRRAQEIQKIGLLSNIGAQQRALQEAQINAPIDGTLNRLGIVGNIIGSSRAPFTPTTGGGSRLSGAIGGATSGAAVGTAIAPGIGTAIGAVGGGILGAFA